MTDQNDSSQIDALISDFYSAFDNRNGVVPDGRRLFEIIHQSAVIAKEGDNVFGFMSPFDFVSPRIQLLTDGRLTDFHEWETSSATEIRQNLASRTSEYSKAGLLNGKPYGGAGTKMFQLIRENESWKILAITWRDHDV